MPIATKVNVTELPGGNGAAILALPDGVQWMAGYNRLFKRDFYDRFIDDHLEGFANPRGCRRRVVMGTEGIGKSSFALYAAWRALQMGKTVVYRQSGNPLDYIVLTPGSGVVHKYIKPNEPPELDDRNVVYISDGVTPHGVDAFTLFVSYPRESSFKWAEDFGASEYYFPTITFEELKLMRTHCFDGRSFSDIRNILSVELTDEELQMRFDVAGGVPRFIFNEEKWRERSQALEISVSDTIHKILNDGLYLAVASQLQTPPDAIHIVPNKQTFDCERTDFASSHVRWAFLSEMSRVNRSVVCDVMSRDNNSRLVAFRGAIHELQVYQSISFESGSWTARSLRGGDADADADADLAVPLPGKAAIDFDSIEEMKPGKAEVATLWRPRIKSCDAPVDFIITVGKQVYFLGCTVTDPSNIDADAAADKRAALLQQAAALAQRGFDTTGALNYVHVAEARVEPSSSERSPIVGDAPPAPRGSRRTKKTVPDADKARVKQYVVDFVPSSSQSRVPWDHHPGPN
jgi:hypothetical protein